MIIFLSILISLLYIIVYSFSSFLFSYKIYLVSNNKYNLAAVVSGFGLFINFSLFAIVPYVAIAISFWWISIILLFSLVIGSFLSTSILSKIDLFRNKLKEEK